MRIAVLSDTFNRVLGRVEDDVFVPIAEGYDPLVHALETGLDLAAAPALGPSRHMGSVALASPIRRPSAIACIGLNYADHARESGLDSPDWPLTFAKFANTLVGHGEPVAYDPTTTSQLDWEVELAVVIGRITRAVNPAEALDSVFGYTVANDVSARDVQRGESQWVRGKSFDSCCPLGPWVVTADEVGDPQALDIGLTVNGEVMQSGNSRDMIFSVAEIIAFLTRTITLQPGDVVLTGTPLGVGMSRVPPVWLKDGDEMAATVGGVGTLRNTVIARPRIATSAP